MLFLLLLLLLLQWFTFQIRISHKFSFQNRILPFLKCVLHIFNIVYSNGAKMAFKLRLNEREREKNYECGLSIDHKKKNTNIINLEPHMKWKKNKKKTHSAYNNFVQSVRSLWIHIFIYWRPSKRDGKFPNWHKQVRCTWSHIFLSIDVVCVFVCLYVWECAICKLADKH